MLQASPETVRKTLHEAKLIDPPPKKRRRNIQKPRRFERATPNQMWQTDICCFRLAGKNAYLLGYIDDYSRYIVGMESLPQPDCLKPVRGLSPSNRGIRCSKGNVDRQRPPVH